MSFTSAALQEVQKALFAADCDAAIFATMLKGNQHLETEESVFHMIDADMFDGVIIFSYSFMNPMTRHAIGDRLRDSKLPVIFLDEDMTGKERFSEREFTLFDRNECCEILINHLVEEHGVKTVDYVTMGHDAFLYNILKDCFLNSFEKYGISVPEDRVHYVNGRMTAMDDCPAIADKLIARGLPDAVVCCDDLNAAAMISAFYERGIYVPDDIIVTGFGRSEPFLSYSNITSVERLPENLAKDTVNKLLAKMNGTEFKPVEGISSGRLFKGYSCGCTHIDRKAIANAAFLDLRLGRSEMFDDKGNHILESLIATESFEEYCKKLDSFTSYLGDIKGFWLCISEGVMHSFRGILDFTPNMFLPYCRTSKGASIDMDRRFDRSVMLPEILNYSEKPRSFIFSSLYLGDTVYGYTVISYGDSGAIFDRNFFMWRRFASISMEKQRRKIIYSETINDSETRDSLTGLLNVRGFKRKMTQRCGKFSMPDKLMRIIAVDIENLRGINTAYGYAEGDKLLQKVAVILTNCCGEDDVCVRLSGDHFFIAGILDADQPFDEVPLNIEKNFKNFNMNKESNYGVHIFTARVTAPITSIEILDKLPYEAIYQKDLIKENNNKKHKTFTRNNAAVESFDPEERQYVGKMLNDNLFTYFFQPIVDAKTGSIVAYEGLMRCKGNVKLSPISVIDHAAAMGRLDDIEKLTMSNLLKFYHDNQDTFGGRSLYINSIPSCTLPDKDFEELYTKYKTIFNKVVVEFTEQTEASSEQLQKVLERSGKTGFKIAIDDYGTGYSNINSLLTFMPNCVKIDRSLISNIHQDKRKQHFTQNIIDYAHDNHFKALAEGIETPEELRTVIAMGIDLIQGYFTAKPAPDLLTILPQQILEKISEFNNAVDNKRVRKTFFPKENSESSLMVLDFDGYTDIFVSTPNFTLKGNLNHVSNTYIRVKDGLKTTIVLENVSMIGQQNEACIALGRNCEVTLEIRDTVSMSGSISVPDSSTLNVVGTGTFNMKSSDMHTYGIGSDRNNSYGNINIRLQSKMFISLNGEECIGIGGGYNEGGSKITLDALDVEINLSGKRLVGIGCIDSPTYVDIRNTKLRLSNRCNNGIGIGSSYNTLDLNIQDSYILCDASGDSISGVSVFSDNPSKLVAKHTKFDMLLKGKSTIGLGSALGVLNIDLDECDIHIACEGSRAIGIGCFSDKADVCIANSTGAISVASGQGMPLTGTKDKLVVKDCTIEMLKN